VKTRVKKRYDGRGRAFRITKSVRHFRHFKTLPRIEGKETTTRRSQGKRKSAERRKLKANPKNSFRVERAFVSSLIETKGAFAEEYYKGKKGERVLKNNVFARWGESRVTRTN